MKYIELMNYRYISPTIEKRMEISAQTTSANNNGEFRKCMQVMEYIT